MIFRKLKAIVVLLVLGLYAGSAKAAKGAIDGLGFIYQDTHGWVTRLGTRINLLNVTHISPSENGYYYNDTTSLGLLWQIYFSGEKQFSPTNFMGFKAEGGKADNFYRFDNENNNYLSSAYTYYQNDWLRFEFGRTLNIYRKVGVAAPQIGFPYISSDLGFVSRPQNFAMLERLLPDTDRNADKISLLTGRLYGWQIGGSYNFGSYSYAGEELSHLKAFDRSFLGMVKNTANFGPLKTMASYAYMQTDLGLYDTSEVLPQKEHAYGLSMELLGVTLGAGYRKVLAGGENNLDSVQYDASLLRPDSRAYNVGLAYSLAAISLSLTYSASWAEAGLVSDKAQNYVLGLEYAPAKTWKLWSSLGYTYFNNREPLDAEKSSGAFIAVGVTLGNY
jgi:hypothetical protein